MTDAERLAKIREWAEGLVGSAGPGPETDYQDCCDRASECAAFEVLQILEAQPDPHPLGSVRFDEATEEQFREFWEAAGFVIGGNAHVGIWADKLVNGFPDELTVSKNGAIDMYEGATSIYLGRLATFQEALDALNELAGTKIMGGWA
jgi:hypothetical protein